MQVEQRTKPRRRRTSGGWWLRRLEEYNHRCAYCGQKFGTSRRRWGRVPIEYVPIKDHVLPKARRGSDHPDNIVPACFDCNVRKGTEIWEPVVHTRKARHGS